MGKTVAFLFLFFTVSTSALSAENADGIRVDSPGATLVMRDNVPAPAGDFNGDGYADLLAGGTCNVGPVWVYHGPIPPGSTLDPNGEPWPGLEIDHAGTAGSRCAVNQSAVGDFNGDGLDDVAIGSQGVNGSSTYSGRVYVVFGRSDPGYISLADFDAGSQGAAGITIDGSGGMRLGQSVSGAGDVNADGFADIIAGSPWGRAFVIYGAAQPESLSTSEIEVPGSDKGFVITTQRNDRNSGFAVDRAGDVNADGFGDVIVGAIGKINDSIGRAYVVFGAAQPASIDAHRDSLKGRGFRIIGRHGGDSTGEAVAGAGDINGDGFDDVVVGTPRHTLACCRGLAFLIYGKPDSDKVKLDLIGDGGFKIRGAERLDDAGIAVAGAGDVNGDGLDDFLVGASFEDSPGVSASGSVNLIYGKVDSLSVKLAHLSPSQGIKFVGRLKEGCDPEAERCADGLGEYLAGIGDIDGDGTPDIAAGGYYMLEFYLRYL